MAGGADVEEGAAGAPDADLAAGGDVVNASGIGFDAHDGDALGVVRDAVAVHSVARCGLIGWRKRAANGAGGGRGGIRWIGGAGLRCGLSCAGCGRCAPRGLGGLRGGDGRRNGG